MYSVSNITETSAKERTISFSLIYFVCRGFMDLYQEWNKQIGYLVLKRGL